MTPVAVERLLAGTGRFNVGFAAVMTVQGVGASLSNVIAGAVVSARGYQAAHLLSGLIAVTAIALFLLNEARRLRRDPAATLREWGPHLIGVALVLGWLHHVALPLGTYALC